MNFTKKQYGSVKGIESKSENELTRTKNSNTIVSVLVTESTASLLGLKSEQHIEDIDSNYMKSKISVVLEGSLLRKVKSEDDNLVRLTYPYEQNVVFTRVEPMSVSSTSVYGLDDLSEDDIAEKCSKQEPLRPQFVQNQSMLIVRSVAHQDKLTLEFNKLYVHLIENEMPVTLSGWVNVCRICHGGESTENLIGPCRCRGSVALAHLSCLERWLKESANSHCELCQHHYQVKREPKYGILKSVLMWLISPGPHRTQLLEDFIAFCLYTPATACSTYILMLLCDCATRQGIDLNSHTAHLVAFFSISGIAAIDFTYSSWLIMCLHRNAMNWRQWYRENCCLTLIIPPRKMRRAMRNNQQETDITD